MPVPWAHSGLGPSADAALGIFLASGEWLCSEAGRGFLSHPEGRRLRLEGKPEVSCLSEGVQKACGVHLGTWIIPRTLFLKKALHVRRLATHREAARLWRQPGSADYPYCSTSLKRGQSATAGSASYHNRIITATYANIQAAFERPWQEQVLETVHYINWMGAALGPRVSPAFCGARPRIA